MLTVNPFTTEGIYNIIFPHIPSSFFFSSFSLLLFSSEWSTISSLQSLKQSPIDISTKENLSKNTSMITLEFFQKTISIFCWIEKSLLVQMKSQEDSLNITSRRRMIENDGQNERTQRKWQNVVVHWGWNWGNGSVSKSDLMNKFFCLLYFTFYWFVDIETKSFEWSQK